jgi:hypothetical protein
MKETCEVVHKPLRSKDKNDKALTSSHVSSQDGKDIGFTKI